MKTENSELLGIAEKASKRAYAPYSEFHVGAAVLLEDGTIIEGSNQENAAYGLCMCAERVALHYAHSAHPDKKILKIALFSPDSHDITPCGSCRQVMAEFARLQGNDFDVVMPKRVCKVSELLPFEFEL